MAIRFGSVFEIPLPDGRFAYGCWFKDVVVGIYDRIATRQVPFERVITRPLRAWKGCNDRYLRQRLWPVVGELPLTGDAVYPPDLAWYAPWLPEDSVRDRRIVRRGREVRTTKAHYLSLVKRGRTVGVFDHPDKLADWIVDHLERWPDEELPAELALATRRGQPVRRPARPSS